MPFNESKKESKEMILKEFRDFCLYGTSLVVSVFSVALIEKISGVGDKL